MCEQYSNDCQYHAQPLSPTVSCGNESYNRQKGLHVVAVATIRGQHFTQ